MGSSIGDRGGGGRAGEAVSRGRGGGGGGGRGRGWRLHVDCGEKMLTGRWYKPAVNTSRVRAKVVTDEKSKDHWGLY